MQPTRQVMAVGNSCRPQLLEQGAPTNEWDPDQVGRYPQVRNPTIDNAENLPTPIYRRLGAV
jgi:hypothetical protein